MKIRIMHNRNHDTYWAIITRPRRHSGQTRQEITWRSKERLSVQAARDEAQAHLNKLKRHNIA